MLLEPEIELWLPLQCFWRRVQLYGRTRTPGYLAPGYGSKVPEVLVRSIEMCVRYYYMYFKVHDIVVLLLFFI